MNLESLRNKLLAAARANPPSDHVPYAFEKRILARLPQSPTLDLGTLWTRMLWRAAAPCVAFALTIGAWSHFGGSAAPAAGESTESIELSPDFETLMLAVVDEQAEELW